LQREDQNITDSISMLYASAKEYNKCYNKMKVVNVRSTKNKRTTKAIVSNPVQSYNDMTNAEKNICLNNRPTQFIRKAIEANHSESVKMA